VVVDRTRPAARATARSGRAGPLGEGCGAAAGRPDCGALCDMTSEPSGWPSASQVFEVTIRRVLPWTSVRPMSDSPLRVVVAKPGLDGHDRGAKVVARALRDAGMEVVYTGLHQTPEQIVEAAIQEDADAVGLSVLSGAHLTLFAKVMELLKERDAADIVVFGGGIIPEADLPELEKLGVAKVFTPGATTTEIVDWVKGNVTQQ